MGIPRKTALERLQRFDTIVEAHLDKLAEKPEDLSIAHWRHETQVWLTQMEAMLRHVGKKTSQEWQERLQSRRRKLNELETPQD